MEVALHELNNGFEWRVPERPLRRVSPAQRKQFDELGYFVLENAFSEDEIRAVRETIDPIEETYAKVLEQQFAESGVPKGMEITRPSEITFTAHIAPSFPVLSQFVRGPVFRDLGHDLIGPRVSLYHDQAVYKKPGTKVPFPWHQDNGYKFVDPQTYVTVWVPLVDATEENGCPWVLPRMHRRGTYRHRMTDLGFTIEGDLPKDAVCVPAKAGSAVVFSSLTPHATGPNLSKGIRKSYIVQISSSDAEIVEKAEDGRITRSSIINPITSLEILAE